MYQVVLDTNVLVAALRSKLGASHHLLQLLGDARWRPNVTVPVVLEYESILKRDCRAFGLTEQDVDDAVDALCSRAGLHRLYFLWRPVASDPNDDLMLEAAIASHSDFPHYFQPAGLSRQRSIRNSLSDAQGIPYTT